jgi:hypothetical protein
MKIGGQEVVTKVQNSAIFRKIPKKFMFLRLLPNILESISYYFTKFCRKDPNFFIKQNIIFVICVKNGLNLDFSRSGLPDHRFSFVKKPFFLSVYSPWTDSLWKNDDPAVSWRSTEQRCNLAQKWPFSSPNRRGQTLIKFKNILYGVYWDQYQGFKAPAFWLNVLFQKATPPYWICLSLSNHNKLLSVMAWAKCLKI